jgi:hypothetical protein
MNRTVLIVICDFLLLTLIATARLDRQPSLTDAKLPEKMEISDYSKPDPSAKPPPNPTPARSTRTADLLDSMKSSLEEERNSRQSLSAMLTRTEQALKTQQQLAAERAQQLANAQQNLRAKEEEARKLDEARNALAGKFAEAQSNMAQIQQRLTQTSEEAKQSQQRLTNIQSQYAAAQANLSQMEKQLSSTSEEAQNARQRLAQIENELRARQTEADLARQRIEQVEKLRQAAELEKVRIAGDLKVAETKHQLTAQQLESVKGQVQTVQKEKEQIQKVASELAQGVVTFAEKQGELAKEIRENRPLTANTIFAEFATNRVDTDFRANRSGILGRTISKNSQTRTILVSDGKQVYSIYHIEETPFRFEEFGKDWQQFIVHIFRGVTILPLHQVSFLSIDPRVVVAPLTDDQVKQLGVKVYKTVNDPYKFNDALIIGADEGYYGECRFTLDALNPNYLKMDRARLGKLVGKFNPSRGDLVFAKSGEIIGLMVNKEYCALLSSFVPQATIPTGTNLNNEAIGLRLSKMQGQLSELPDSLKN